VHKWMTMFLCGGLIWIHASSLPGFTSINISTLPEPYSTVLTIYERGDFTLVQERYLINLKEGVNTLQFDWSGTLIDLSSVELKFLLHPDRVNLEEIILPVRGEKLLLWKIQAEEPVRELIEVSYFTRGISWQADYDLAINEQRSRVLKFQGWVRIKNQSGRDFLKSRIMLITGEPHLLGRKKEKPLKAALRMRTKIEAEALPPPISKEAVSEYYLYQIEGENDLRTDQESTFSLFRVENIPLLVTYRFNSSQNGLFPVILCKFKNTQKFSLPPGVVRGWLCINGKKEEYLGEASIDFIPPDEDIKLSLGKESRLKLTRKKTSFTREDPQFSKRNDLVQYFEREEYTLKITNFSNQEVKIEIREQIPGEWEFITSTVPLHRREANALEFRLTLPERGEGEVIYQIRKIVRLR